LDTGTNVVVAFPSELFTVFFTLFFAEVVVVVGTQTEIFGEFVQAADTQSRTGFGFEAVRVAVGIFELVFDTGHTGFTEQAEFFTDIATNGYTAAVSVVLHFVFAAVTVVKTVLVAALVVKLGAQQVVELDTGTDAPI